MVIVVRFHIQDGQLHESAEENSGIVSANKDIVDLLEKLIDLGVWQMRLRAEYACISRPYGPRVECGRA